jgi:hypothetical protein
MKCELKAKVGFATIGSSDDFQNFRTANLNILDFL